MKHKPPRCRQCKTTIQNGKCDCRQRVKAYLPTRSEIEAECQRIRATWSEAEYWKRDTKGKHPARLHTAGKEEDIESSGDA